MLVFMIWPAVIAGGASLIGGYLANRGRKGQAENQERFQERMRNTEWQATVEDMRKAGINPALAYSQGGASSPHGAMAPIDDVVSGGVSSAQAARRLKVELKNMARDTELKEEQALETQQRRFTSHSQEEYIDQQRQGQEVINQLATMSLPAASNAAAVQRSKFGKGAAYGNLLRQVLFGGGGPGSLFSGALGAYVGAKARSR